ncbi:MAG TPA: TolC family protein, partial [Gillisia sp.]|nr:TolC family protein [Gillisia sp.]
MKNILIILVLFYGNILLAQERLPEVLTFEEYLAFVKQYHPVARQAGLRLNMAEAELLRARGGFDPKIEVDYDRKEFKNTEYYDILNSTFKIPTWYGIELKANFEQNQGVYLNPQRTVPQDGLFSAGVSVDVGQGMFINERMASLRTAKIYRDRSLAERDLMVNDVLYEASLAYFDWLRVYNEMIIYEGFLENALERYQGIAQNARLGEIPAIDTVEARISVQNRRLDLE